MVKLEELCGLPVNTPFWLGLLHEAAGVSLMAIPAVSLIE